MFRRTLFATAALLVASASPALAEISIHQKGKKFSEKSITIKAGTTVTFINDDKVAHNVYSRSSAGKFDTGAQQPGTTLSHVFDKPGKVKVRCAIHPRMKLTVNVQ